MASPAARSASSRTVPVRPNTAFRQLRGRLSPGEFAAAVRRSAREIGEQVSCDARYVGRVESGEIRCPNYAYERVFRHMFPGLTLPDMGFTPRETVRGRGAQHEGAASAAPAMGASPARTESRAWGTVPAPVVSAAPLATDPDHRDTRIQICEESDVLRRAFITGGPAAALGLAGLWPGDPFGPDGSAAVATVPGPRTPPGGRAGATEATAVEEAVRRIRLLDDRHGADGLYPRATQPLRAAYELLDSGVQRRAVYDRLQAGAGELAISVGWLAHDSGRFDDARSHYAEALSTARVCGDAALEAHAFCNTAFLARDAGRPREAVRAAQAAQQAAKQLSSPRLRSLLALREAGGRAGLGDRTGCEQALARAERLFAAGPGERDPEWMTFYGEAELAGLEAQCWSALGETKRAAEHARRAVALQDPHFTRNIALFTAELAGNLAAGGAPEEAAAAGIRALALLEQVRSARIRAMLDSTARKLRPYRSCRPVPEFLEQHAASAGRQPV
ncbi:tetratricopeptide repeat protein [Streptomyces sp. GS7]|uniref:tetratricopeptide repeat protein n=1 Tax=Streptomyces sp. GS7 TaxID=2692234 RepID=UPI0013173E2D|nr:tetratricopeptide repeat protein [Streptomyces sp. GS7]QHC20939.1 tetratricopeptide repeat protein [Streptomyces sp. GS7]